LPFYLYLFGALIAGVVLGGLATWMTHARWRRSARRGEADARRRRAETEPLSRERQLEAPRQLEPAGR
jgi:hypothetical protein